LNVDYDTEYKVTINGTAVSFKTRTNYTTGDPPPKVEPMKLQEVTDGLKAALAAYNPVVVKNVIELTFTADTKVEVEAGISGLDLEVIQDSATNISKLPEQSIHNRLVEIVNTAKQDDSYWVKFVAEDGVKGKGYWEETKAPTVSAGLDAATMPQAVIRKSDGTFVVIPFDGKKTITVDGNLIDSPAVHTTGIKLWWEPRLVGDERTNSHPSFVGQTISDVFFYSNRMGFLTEDNVSMSQVSEYFNFYHKSAATQTPADPIDLSCSSVKPAVLHAVLPKPQGLLLFSANQQFLMEAENDVWTPSTVIIRTLSNYECDRYLHPVDIGAPTFFVTKNDSWSRIFELITRGQKENPQIVDQTSVVNEWIPNNIDLLSSNSPNGLVTTSYRKSPDIHLFRIVERNDERQMASWVRWVLHGNVLYHQTNNDKLYAIVETAKGYDIVSHTLVLSPTSSGLVNNRGDKVDPYLDSWSLVSTSTYDQIDNRTKVYLPKHLDSTKQLLCVVGTSKTNANNDNSGLVVKPQLLTDTNGQYFTVRGDISDHYIYIGYQYRMEVSLPRYIYRSGDSGPEIAGSTIISRFIVYAALSGAIYFSLKTRGRKDWVDFAGIRMADYYQADDVPMNDYTLYKVPVLQRPQNFDMKIFSDNPFPVSLVAMVWEGQYSPKFYGRE
jgi:hypothetical protein